MPHEPRIRHPGADQDRPFPALLTKLHQLATPAVEDEWIEPEEASLCGTPYRRPQQKISHAESKPEWCVVLGEVFGRFRFKHKVAVFVSVRGFYHLITHRYSPILKELKHKHQNN